MTMISFAFNRSMRVKHIFLQFDIGYFLQMKIILISKTPGQPFQQDLDNLSK